MAKVDRAKVVSEDADDGASINGDGDTDPRITLDRIQITEHGLRLGLIQKQLDEIYGLVSKIARKVGVKP